MLNERDFTVIRSLTDKVSHGYFLRVYGAAGGSLQELVRLYDEFGMSNIQKE